MTTAKCDIRDWHGGSCSKCRMRRHCEDVEHVERPKPNWPETKQLMPAWAGVSSCWPVWHAEQVEQLCYACGIESTDDIARRGGEARTAFRGQIAQPVYIEHDGKTANWTGEAYIRLHGRPEPYKRAECTNPSTGRNVPCYYRTRNVCEVTGRVLIHGCNACPMAEVWWGE